MIKISDKTKNILEWIACVVIAIVIAILIRYFVGTPTVVQQPSMFPTLKENQRLILNRLSRTLNQMPQRGDIITFEAPSNSYATQLTANYENEPTNIFSQFMYHVLEINKMSYIKRVIGLPGERVTIEDGKVYINNEELEEDYLQPNVVTEAKNSLLIDFVVPDNCIFAMGDNRTQSADCRVFGCIPLDKVESKVWIRFWPFDLFGEVK